MFDELTTNPRPPHRPHGVPPSDDLIAFMGQHWADPSTEPASSRADSHPGKLRTSERRQLLSNAFPKARLIIPAGTETIRTADQAHRFRPESNFVWLTGLTAGYLSGSVLVLEPVSGGHDAVLYARPGSQRGSETSYLDRHSGELWVGPRPSLRDYEESTGLPAKPVTDLKAPNALGKNALVSTGKRARDLELRTQLAEARLVKDDWEIEQVQAAVDAAEVAFTKVVGSIGAAVESGRGERWVEGVFNHWARLLGNGPASDTIAANGPHAGILHWTSNDGPLVEGELLLLDAGVEAHSLYCSDITRTMPVSGEFSSTQRDVYEIVQASQQAGIDAVTPGASFLEFHAAAMNVIVEGLADLSILPTSKQETLDKQLYRRWTLTGGSGHMIGLDVHDCGEARLSRYRDGLLEPGMILTVEPGLYFQSDDELLPPDLRGIGIRIEDEVLVTPTGSRVISGALPRTADALTSWIGELA